MIPMNFTPYMEHTYYGVMIPDLLGEKTSPSQTIDFVLGARMTTEASPAQISASPPSRTLSRLLACLENSIFQ